MSIVRSFTVFQDPSPVQDKAIVDSELATPETTPSSSASSSLTPAENYKENMHPVKRTVLSSSKPVKSGVLVPKVVLAVVKKRKAPTVDSVASVAASSVDDGLPKKVLVVLPKKKTKTRPATRKPTSLPKVEESDEAAPAEVNLSNSFVRQARINSRCYDLTVSPLADVTPAYETCVQERSGLGDYFPTTKHATKTSAPVAKAPLAGEENVGENVLFTTPERKRMWAAFTFSSPSPSSKRFGGGGENPGVRERSDSIPQFGDAFATSQSCHRASVDV